MPHVRSPQAESDLDDIWYYVASETGNVDTADRVIDGIVRCFLLLAKYPRVGRTRDELRPGLRSFPVDEYVVFHRLTESVIFKGFSKPSEQNQAAVRFQETN